MLSKKEDDAFTLSRSSSRSRVDSRRPRSIAPPCKSNIKRRSRAVLFNMRDSSVHSYEKDIENKNILYYSIGDLKEIRKENMAAVQEVVEACASNVEDKVLLNGFVRSSLRGLEYCVNGRDGNMELAIKHVIDNQGTMSPLVLAARYSKISKPSQLEAMQRGSEDEKAAKSVNTAPVRPRRQISRQGDVIPHLPHRKTSDHR